MSVKKDKVGFSVFQSLDIRVGVIEEVRDFPKARKPAYRLKIYFGPDIGYRQSSAQITNYRPEELVGRKVIAVVNFPPKQVADFMSEVLVLGALTPDGVKLLSVDEGAQPGDVIG
ncbi:tRNA-binding protein [Thermogymnomonas acidicola]|uniref:tRNA-binding protein n=1 Tax=Thermogymnomonas acidicola TaxID=399579 RepID=A0AA37FAA6_9ARCH|nr:tRNA-binding protein [Thermogymnomonas acidicola]GGM78754.1 tRNA-binding protein [Thermogymnomonas acidicola]